MVEERVAPARPGAKPARGKARSLATLAEIGDDAPRLLTGDPEFDRVCGGGLARGAALLIGGAPGIGKSTLLLQISAHLARGGHEVVYVSGEEAPAQIGLRAARLGVADAPVALAAETRLADILATLRKARPAVAIIDSIQTLWSEAAGSAPGAVTQVRACAQELVSFAKSTGVTVILVGHVTKDGQIAGPRVVEHMVDAVLYFEHDPGRNYRILRAVKNRFGPAQEIGVFEMTGRGLAPVGNPSALFLAEREAEASGAAVFAGIAGARPILMEFQALAAPSNFGSPRRAVVGWDLARLNMLLAVLEARCGLRFSERDIYLNVAGGLRVSEPAADLAAAAALVSALFDAPLPADLVVFGEVSLSGGLRPAAQTPARLNEAARLGFSRALMPDGEAEEFGVQIAERRFKTLRQFASSIAALGGDLPPDRSEDRETSEFSGL
ncbi:MAG: DNA repair protein RadA [Parvularculaceae bacterium]